jgi:energy-coupling factor transporter ATP-binding protein EcfA2
LKDISLSYFYGAKIGVLGLNGSGKSSLLRILAGVDKEFNGQTILSPGYTVGYLEQEPLVDCQKTVREVVEGLCCDRELQAVRGQVVVLERQALPHAWIDDTHERPRYVIPRPDDVVVGGTAQIGNHRLEPDDADTRAIVAAVAERFPALGRAAVRAVRVGLRPYRPSVRVEIERPAPGRRLVHNYGHGGAGYTLAWGCAEEVAGLVAG